MANISLNVGATSVNASLMTPTNIKDGSVTTDKIADGAVTTEKLNEDVRGQISDLKSAIDLHEYDATDTDILLDNTSMYPSTSFGTSTNYKTLAFMPVRKGDVVLYTGNTGATTNVAIVNTYTTDDASGYYSTLSFGNVGIYENHPFKITDEKIKYVACCFRTAESDPFSVTVIHSIPMLMDSVEEIENDLYQQREIHSYITLNGYYGNTAFTESSTRFMKVYDVSEMEKVHLIGTFPSYQNVYTLLDENLSIIGYRYNNSSNNTQFDVSVNVADGVWLYVGTMANIEQTIALTAYGCEDDVQYLQHMNGVPTMGFYHDTTWNATASAPTLLYDVTEGESVFVTGTGDSWFNLYTFVDASNNVLEYKRSLAGAQARHLIVPTGSTKLYVATSVANSATLVTYKLKHFGKEKTNWTDKKIVWFGTSIPAGGYIGDSTAHSYPKYIADMLGADVYNEAIGSSNVHCKQPDRVNADTNPYGFIGNFESCSRCLTNTTEEMQWIIDHYNSSIWTSGTVPQMPDVLKNQILANSYQTKLDKWLTASTFPNLFVFDHGHNDPFNSLATENEYYQTYGEYSLYSYRGAMNFLIQRILNFNPYAKIVLIGEYTGKDTDQIPTMQVQVADDWEIPICKDWDKLGWTKTKSIVVYGSWVRSGSAWTWVSSDTPTTMTVFNRWIPDGVHPHTDPSHKALEHMAEIIGQWLRNDIG